MVRVSIVDDSLAARVLIGKHKVAADPTIRRAASRRGIRFTSSLVMAARDSSTSLGMTRKVSGMMKSTRRQFIKLSVATAGAFALSGRSTSLFAEKTAKPMRILILGGTGFTGPYQVQYALSRGHRVTTFNRGKTHPGELPGEVEQLIGDRNGKLDALKDRQWDVVIDNPTTLPAWVRDAAQILKDNVERYIFISTISVYGDVKTGPDENALTEKYEGADPYKETLEAMKAGGYKTYGPLKALSEREAEKWVPGETLIIRPGLIVGPRDETDRFTYWPVRIDRDGEVLAPGSPSDPVQFIDARDLAEWTIRMAENRETGIYNATGPAKPLGIGGMLDQIKAALKSNATFTWVREDFLTQQKVEPWSDMPVWTGNESGVARAKIDRALSKGLTFRPLAETARDTLAWFKSLPQERQSKLKAGLTSEREAEVLATWKKQKQL
jgi:2'-hydroxyisoflavone reductase